MTESEAYRVLGLPENAGPEHIRTRYRELIVQVHPDKMRRRSSQSSDQPGRERETDSQEHQAAPFTTPHDARIINQAYNLLQCSWRKTRNSREARASSDGQDFQQKTAQSTGKWDAPCNPYAYHPREIYCRAEDAEGIPIGIFTIARGKYLWSQDEEFPLFLKSVYQCGSELLKEADASQKREADDSRRQRALGELTYLLAQQFIDVRSSLDELAKAVTVGDSSAGRSTDRIWFLPAMLEYGPRSSYTGRELPKTGDLLYPSELRHRRLFLKDVSGEELGYLSFKDDRLYYIVIPLFEQRRVQVRIRVSEGPASQGKAKNTSFYQNLDLYIRLDPLQHQFLPENLNLQIEKILREYSSPAVHVQPGKSMMKTASQAAANAELARAFADI